MNYNFKIKAKAYFKDCTHYEKGIAGLVRGTRFIRCDRCMCEIHETETKFTKFTDGEHEADMVKICSEYLGMKQYNSYLNFEAVDVDDVSDEYTKVCPACSEEVFEDFYDN